jgi:hypothetical protein
MAPRESASRAHRGATRRRIRPHLVLPGATRDCESPVSAANSRLVGDVVVHLSVKVPAGMRLTVNTINGDVSIETESRVLVAESVNGNVVVRSSEGSVVASGAAGASS